MRTALTASVSRKAPPSAPSQKPIRPRRVRKRYEKPSTETTRARIRKLTPAQAGAITYEPSCGAHPEAPGTSRSPRSARDPRKARNDRSESATVRDPSPCPFMASTPARPRERAIESARDPGAAGGRQAEESEGEREEERKLRLGHRAADCAVRHSLRQGERLSDVL